jgi:hypothetical protein
VGEVADVVKSVVENNLGMKIKLTIKHLQDFRNYKVSIDKAKNVLSFKPIHDVASISYDLIKNKDLFKDFLNSKYYNIKVLEAIKNN